MRFKGDRTGSITVGEVMGPGNDGLYRQVTDCWYDEIDKHTYVEADIVQMAPGGRDLRYFGSTDPTADPPPVRERLNDEVTPQ